MSLKNWIQGQKDNSVSFVIEKLLQKKIEPYGRLVEFKLDSRRKNATIRVLLKGETEPVTILVEEYEVTQASTGISATLKRASASREWLTQALQDFAVGKSLVIPEQYASYVRMLL